jgi:2-(1,2-epoxy-1,2-dihydrophenyl)acetyl-CoA isomerase
MPEPTVLVATLGAVRTLTLNRPAALNSFTAQMHGELLPALQQAADDSTIRAVVITGAGRGFCAGQDLSDPAMTGDVDVGAVIERFYRPLATRVRSMPVPVIACVNGVAAGAGANLALCCDFVVAARNASFIQAFSKIGLVPDCGGTWLLPRLVGRARALGLALSGDKLPAEESERIGLIWKCVDDAALADTVQALAQKLALMPSRALAETRRVIDAAMPMPFADALAQEASVQRELGRGGDFAEGVAAFFAKRPPAFKDRLAVTRTPQQVAEATGEAMSRGDRASRLLGLQLLAIGPGSASMSMVVREDMLNGHDTCHGGFITTLADSCFAFACNAYNEITVASGFDMNLIAAARLGDELTATAHELSKSGRTGIYDIQVRNQRGQAVAAFRGRSYTMKGKPLIEGLPVGKQS